MPVYTNAKQRDELQNRLPWLLGLEPLDLCSIIKLDKYGNADVDESLRVQLKSVFEDGLERWRQRSGTLKDYETKVI